MHSPKLSRKPKKLQRDQEGQPPFFKFKELYVHVPWCISTFISSRKPGFILFIVSIVTRKPTVKSQRRNPRRKRINRTTFHTQAIVEGLALKLGTWKMYRRSAFWGKMRWKVKRCTMMKLWVVWLFGGSLATRYLRVDINILVDWNFLLESEQWIEYTYNQTGGKYIRSFWNFWKFADFLWAMIC